MTFGKFNKLGQFTFNFTEAVYCLAQAENKTKIMNWNSTNEGKNYFEFYLVHGDEYYY